MVLVEVVVLDVTAVVTAVVVGEVYIDMITMTRHFLMKLLCY